MADFENVRPFNVRSYVGNRLGTGIHSGAESIEEARRRAWDDVAYYAIDPETGYFNVGYAIESVCVTCGGSGLIHRKKRLKVCRSAYHKMFSPRCYLECPDCHGEPYRELETKRQVPPDRKPLERRKMRMMPAKSQVRATIDYLRACQALRATRAVVSFTTDPAWLVDIAINRRAGWPDDPSHSRGSAFPVMGRYPRKAEGLEFNHLRTLARAINTPRLRVYRWSLGEWSRLLMSRIPDRFCSSIDD